LVGSRFKGSDSLIGAYSHGPFKVSDPLFYGPFKVSDPLISRDIYGRTAQDVRVGLRIAARPDFRSTSLNSECGKSRA